MKEEGLCKNLGRVAECLIYRSFPKPCVDFNFQEGVLWFSFTVKNEIFRTLTPLFHDNIYYRNKRVCVKKFEGEKNE